MKTNFRVLLIDDNKEVLDNLKHTIKTIINVESNLKEKIEARVEIDTLHVILQQKHGGNNYEISDETINNLLTSCGTDFDFIFSDYAFIGDETKNRNLRAELLANNENCEKKHLDGWALGLNDIKQKITSLESSNPEKHSLLKAKFLNHKGIIQIYTNSPEPFSALFNSIELQVRKNEVHSAFNLAKNVDFILMHDEFKINRKIDDLFQSEPEKKKYYAGLLSNRLNSLIESTVLKYMVIDQRKYKMGDIKKSFAYLNRLAIAFGAISAVSGEMLFHFLKHPLIESIKELGKIIGVEIELSILGEFCIFIVLALITYFGLNKLSIKIASSGEKTAEYLTSIRDNNS